jgi:hypothetical protein
MATNSRRTPKAQWSFRESRRNVHVIDINLPHVGSGVGVGMGVGTGSALSASKGTVASLPSMSTTALLPLRAFTVTSAPWPTVRTPEEFVMENAVFIHATESMARRLVSQTKQKAPIRSGTLRRGKGMMFMGSSENC